MSKVKNFEQDFPSTRYQECDGLTRHAWKVVTAVPGLSREDLNGICWCETCGALGRWNNAGPEHDERVTEIGLPVNSRKEF